MRLETNHRRGIRAISLTPLIDVVFILLLFFMLASNFQQWHALTLNVPAAAPGSPTGSSQNLVLQLSNDGTLLSNGEAVLPGTLAKRTAHQSTDTSAQKIVIRPVKDVELQVLITVIDELSEAGIDALSLGSVVQ